MINLDHVHFQQNSHLFCTKHLAIFTQLRLFVNMCCVYFTQLHGSFCSRMLRQISHLFTGSLWITANTFGVHQCTVTKIISQVCHAINSVLGPTYLHLRRDVNELREKASEF
jgi:hypothetical protein